MAQRTPRAAPDCWGESLTSPEQLSRVPRHSKMRAASNEAGSVEAGSLARSGQHRSGQPQTKRAASNIDGCKEPGKRERAAPGRVMQSRGLGDPGDVLGARGSSYRSAGEPAHFDRALPTSLPTSRGRPNGQRGDLCNVQVIENPGKIPASWKLVLVTFECLGDG